MVAPLISVIDDDQSMLASLVDLLRSAGYPVASFATAETFLASKARSSTACLVTDVQLAGVDGLELARRLGKGQRPLPVILITGSVDPTIDAEASACGAECLLRKPFRAAQLIECIERSLSS